MPSAAQQEALHFIDFLKLRYRQYPIEINDNLSDMEDEPFVGMWRDRSDMADSNEWVRNLRKSA